MAGGVVELDTAAFRAEFPQFADTTAWPDSMLQAQWAIAGRFVDNSATSRLSYDFRADVLPFVLCHLLTLLGRNGGGLMGALTQATEGSVSAGQHLDATPGSAVVDADAVRGHGVGPAAAIP